jgi:O-antigen/teichoic acid export membrane protein
VPTKFADGRKVLPVHGHGTGKQRNEKTKRIFESMSQGTGTIAMPEATGRLSESEPLSRSGIAAPVETVGGRAARGAFWTLAFSILGKCATLGCQIGLAWFLTPEHFGLASLALSVTALTSITGGTNLKNILIHRGNRFESEAGQVFWLSLTLSVSAGVLLAVSAPLAAQIFHEPRVIPLLYILALTAPFQSLPTIYSASLGRQLRFKASAAVHFIGAFAQSSFAVFLAWQGYGVYSLILPVLAVALVMAVTFRLVAGPIAIERPVLSRWRNLLSPMSWLMTNSLLLILQTYGVTLVIGSVEKSATTAGFYSWGYAVASQAVFLLATNLQSVLFPVLTRLQHDPDRQFEAFRQSGRTLLAVVIPLCLAQTIFGPKIISLLFHERWNDAIPVIQWLSVGLCLQPLSTLTTSLLLARGGYRTLAALNGGFACCIPVAALIGAHLGNQHQIAICVGLSLVLMNLVSGAVAVRTLGQSLRELSSILLAPLFIGLVTAGAVWFLDRTLPFQQPVVEIVLLGLAGLAVYVTLMRWLLPQVASGLIARLRHRGSSVENSMNPKSSLAA